MVSDPRIVVYRPVRGPGELQLVVPVSPHVVWFARRTRVEELHGTIGVHPKDGDEGIFAGSIVDVHTVATVQDRFIATVQPDSRGQFILGRSRSRHDKQPQ